MPVSNAVETVEEWITKSDGISIYTKRWKVKI